MVAVWGECYGSGQVVYCLRTYIHGATVCFLTKAHKWRGCSMERVMGYFFLRIVASLFVSMVVAVVVFVW